MLIKIPLLHQSLGPRVCLSFCLSLWLIPWSVKAGCVTQGILASFLLSLSHRQLRTTKFRSIKGPTSGAHFIILLVSCEISSKILNLLFPTLSAHSLYHKLSFFYIDGTKNAKA